MPAHNEMNDTRFRARPSGMDFILLGLVWALLVALPAGRAGAQQTSAQAQAEPPAKEAPAATAEQAPAMSPESTPTPPNKAPAPPEAPAPAKIHRDTQVTVGSSLTIKKGEVARDVVVFSGSLRVEGQVIGDAVAVGGSAWIDGEVTGDVTAVGGSVHLGPEAQVLGDVNAIGGSVHREEGAKVLGQVNNVGVGPLVFRGNNHVFPHRTEHWRNRWVEGWSPMRHVMLLFWKILEIMVLMLFACLALVLFPRRLERVEDRLEHEPWKAALVGLGAEILFAPLLLAVVVLLAVSIIGIPLLLLVPFMILAFFLTAFFGFTASAHRIGRWAEDRFSWHFGNPYLQMVVGVGLIIVISLCGRIIGLGGGFLTFFSVSLLIIGWLVQYVAWTVGLGAALLSRWGAAPKGETAALPAPSSPPAGSDGGSTGGDSTQREEDLFAEPDEGDPPEPAAPRTEDTKGEAPDTTREED